MKQKRALAFKKSFYDIKNNVIKNGNLEDNTKRLNKAVYNAHDQELIKTYNSAIAVFKANLPNYQAKSNAQIDNFALNRELTDKNMKIMRYNEEVLRPIFKEICYLQNN